MLHWAPPWPARDNEGPTMQRAPKTTLRLEKGGGIKAKNKTRSRMREKNMMLKGAKPFKRKKN